MDKWASGQVRQLMGSQVNELSDRSPARVKFARHITPLSPWRGVGGEAGSGEAGSGEAGMGKSGCFAALAGA